MTALRQLYEMPVGIAQEGPYLVAPVNWRGEELGSARAQYLVSGKAVQYADIQLAADGVRVGRRCKGHRRLIAGGIASNREQQFAAYQAEVPENVGNLANHRCPQ